jgi:preprotein translocase subunit SecE
VAKKPKKAKKSSASTNSGGPNVIRIKAGSSSSSKKPTAKKEVVVAETVASKAPRPTRTRRVPRPVAATGGYFKGAWVELRQVRWPNRRATWSLTGAVIAYSAFFVLCVLLLDAAFKYLFELILGK